MTKPTCLNCDRALDEDHPLFCSDRCREIAKAVRYGRAVNADGRIDRDPTVEEALKIKIAIAVGGGYPTKQRALTKYQRRVIFERDAQKCQACGAKATEIDHIGAGIDENINHPDNLQALCSECHRDKTRSGFRPANETEIVELISIQERIHSPECLRKCDIPDWKEGWRGLRSERLEQLRLAT